MNNTDYLVTMAPVSGFGYIWQQRGGQRLARVVWPSRRATVGQIAEKVNAGSDRKVSEHKVHRMGLRSRRPVRVPTLTPVHYRKSPQWAREHQNS